VKQSNRKPPNGNQHFLVSRPSTWLFFWVLVTLLPLYPFTRLPFVNYQSANLSIWLPVLLLEVAICVRLCESTILKKQGAYPLPIRKRETYIKIQYITYFSTIVSLSVITFSILVIFLFSDLSISSSQQALEERSPSFGKVLTHLRTIAIPGIIILNNQTRLKWATPAIILFFIFSMIYSFFGGERLFFFETAFTYLIGRELAGTPIVTRRNILIFATAAVTFFTIVEAGKRYFTAGYDTIDRVDLAADLNYFIERPLAYYADPTGKLHYAIEHTNGRTTFTWYSLIINSYADRVGLGISLPPGGINNPYWTSGYGYSGLTNPGGFTVLYLDFGAGAIPMLIMMITVAITSLVLVRNKGIISLALIHPLLIIALFEIPRVPYIYFPRFWLIGLVIVFLYAFLTMCHKAKYLKSNSCAE